MTGYLVERCQGAGCTSFAQIGTPTGTAFGDTGLSASTSYSYRVRAPDAAGNLSGVLEHDAARRRGGAGHDAADGAERLVGDGGLRHADQLSWTASTDNVGVTAY